MKTVNCLVSLCIELPHILSTLNKYLYIIHACIRIWNHGLLCDMPSKTIQVLCNFCKIMIAFEKKKNSQSLHVFICYSVTSCYTSYFLSMKQNNLTVQWLLRVCKMWDWYRSSIKLLNVEIKCHHMQQVLFQFLILTPQLIAVLWKFHENAVDIPWNQISWPM